jgi:hypothetical protein
MYRAKSVYRIWRKRKEKDVDRCEDNVVTFIVWKKRNSVSTWFLCSFLRNSRQFFVKKKANVHLRKMFISQNKMVLVQHAQMIALFSWRLSFSMEEFQRKWALVRRDFSSKMTIDMFHWEVVSSFLWFLFQIPYCWFNPDCCFAYLTEICPMMSYFLIIIDTNKVSLPNTNIHCWYFCFVTFKIDMVTGYVQFIGMESVTMNKNVHSTLKSKRIFSTEMNLNDFGIMFGLFIHSNTATLSLISVHNFSPIRQWWRRIR